MKIELLNSMGDIMNSLTNSQMMMNKGGVMKEVILEEYTNQEIDWISEMIQEKLVDMGYENVSTFSFDINVRFNEEE